ncbi:hypothetical protein EW146_g3159 [Bondarzewia mesenterica]|uniref:Uncharacterized protein n=1 Tax=Bondarzewia mesenterica TaxID=1095465 RepID=A0A4S4LYV3_9AGAM|nr:hypothetical protein EW146_g3159 [Bondarzewia mesenterica]
MNEGKAGAASEDVRDGADTNADLTYRSVPLIGRDLSTESMPAKGEYPRALAPELEEHEDEDKEWIQIS